MACHDLDKAETLASSAAQRNCMCPIVGYLADGATGIDFGRELARNGIPYVFVSGNIKKIPDDFAGALGAIEKPYTMNGMKNALSYISAIVDGDETVEPPASLVLAEDAMTTRRVEVR